MVVQSPIPPQISQTFQSPVFQTHIARGFFSIIMHNPYLATFIAAILSEEILVFLAILSGRGIFPFWIVYVFGIISIIIFDSVVFYIGKSKFGKYIEDRFFPEKKMNEKIKFSNKKSSLFYIILTKFVWGTRIASIFYFSVKGIRYKRFVLYDFIAVLLWATILLPIGFLAGKGFDSLLRFTRGAERILLLVVITIVLIFVIDKIIKIVLKKEAKYVK